MGTAHARIAQLLFAEEHPFNFKQLIEELYCTLTQLDDTEVSLEWDGAHLARFDLPSVRIVLVAIDRPCKIWATCMTISVEPSPNGSELACGASYELTCSSLVKYLSRRHAAVTTIWHQVKEPLTTDLHNRLAAALPLLTLSLRSAGTEEVSTASASMVLNSTEEAELMNAPQKQSGLTLVYPCRAPETRSPEYRYGFGTEQVARRSSTSLTNSVRKNSRSRANIARARGKAHFTVPEPTVVSITDAVRNNASLPETFDRDFARVRDTFNYVEPEQIRPSLITPLRFAAYAMNAALILVWSPLGLE
ncbi:MAG: hypothetical protein U0934_11440 [Pseudotabrizicola sp.]|uniref:hypothetical protein n=1 Tax=Pseudotabrizicola sp. TaxID=2939647 RepID=UPI00272FA37F|nr:hypothetical protein [Pseudotabrizicola sp.]MDP2081136.1 hypothetical protein [Pseudotabrizicola sp.]MDZ7574554.1 hypothetical protein [Pseudotabrizicola sp.]